MTDAISRSAAIDLAYCAIKPTYDCPSAVSVVNVEDIENLPALDVQPVVRCKDCAKRDRAFMCPPMYFGFYPHDDWYCADGVRDGGDSGAAD